MRLAKRIFNWARVGFQSSVVATIALATSVTFAQGPGPESPGGSTTVSVPTGEVTSVDLTKNIAQSGVAYLKGSASFEASVPATAPNASYVFKSRVNIKEIGSNASNSLWQDEREKTISRSNSFTWSMGNGDPGTARTGTGTSYVLYAFIYLKDGTSETLLDDDSDTLVW